ncbi:MAG: 50S ribosomal protein L5 [Nitrospinota bacterium]|nr:50S ribosomal protein L5 [Nitrospinota bacterium]
MKGTPPRAEPSRLRARYLEEIAPQLRKEFNYKNPVQVPRLSKVIVNMGLGDAIQDGKVLESGVEELGLLTGQKPVITKARKSIAAFKLREGMSIGARVTLRGDRMYEFLDRLMNVALPRVRDFRGISGKSFDGRGNFALGIREQVIFPEIDYDKVDKIRGLGVSVVTTARTDEEGKALLKHLGMPFRD